ncbi:MAG: PIN domain-containing protein [Bacteroides sp.]|nr:PIN domain-containing protein [Bacteroides sp.]
MKRIFLDTNIIIDFIFERDGAEDAANILQLGEDGKIELAVSFLTMANTAYITRKGHTQEQLYSIMADLSAILKTLPMDEPQLRQALEQPATDFEDMLQYQCAKANFCDMIITRNSKHFTFAEIPVLTPSDFLKEDYSEFNHKGYE